MEPRSTIAAISTPFGVGGIGIVRISGPAAFTVAGKIFCANNGKSVESMRGYTSALGHVRDASGAHFDDAIIQVFRAPRSYTGEDVAEISCHGGLWILQKLLRLCIENGAEAASAGEFTKRAFLNGKLDLTQAEAVMNLISAQGESAVKAAVSARDGNLSRKINVLAQKLVERSAQLAAWADFPDEDLEEPDKDLITQDLGEVKQELSHLLETYDTGKILREGISAVIVGKPNVGKSTLMNLLLKDERSIVTDIPGTTRDVIEDSAVVGGFILRLADTAGIRDTADLVEQAGVERSRKKIDASELIFAVFDSSGDLTAEDEQLLKSLINKPCIAVINKTDLPQRLDIEKIKGCVPRLVKISAKNNEGLSKLEAEIISLTGVMRFDVSAAVLQSERQRLCLQNAKDSIDNAETAFVSDMLDAANVCIDYAINELLTLTGERASDRVVDEVFSKFCVGK